MPRLYHSTVFMLDHHSFLMPRPPRITSHIMNIPRPEPPHPIRCEMRGRPRQAGEEAQEFPQLGIGGKIII